MDLKSLQRGLAQLIRAGSVSVVSAGPPDAATAAYLQAVTGTKGLKVMRDVVRDWRYLLLRQGCPLTTGALLGEACFAAVADQFLRETALEPLAQSVAARFLGWIAHRRDDDTGSLAQFEQALINQGRGTSTPSVVIQWRCHPMDAIAAALHAKPMPQAHAAALYATDMAVNLPGGFVIRDLPTATVPAAAILAQRNRRKRSA